MNFRILAASVWPRGRVFAGLAATALTASLLAAGVQAQQQPAHQKNNRRGNQNELSEPLLQEATARRALHQ